MAWVPDRPNRGTPEPAQRVLLEVQDRRRRFGAHWPRVPGHVLGREIDHQRQRDDIELVGEIKELPEHPGLEEQRLLRDACEAVRIGGAGAQASDGR
jgi:hypothetical protein